VVTRFLLEPALFPARVAGETFGDHAVHLELAGELFRIEGLSQAQMTSVQSRYGPPLLDASTTRRLDDSPAALQTMRVSSSEFVPIDTRGWEYEVDLHWREDGFTLSGMNVMARIEGDRGGLWTSVEDESAFWGVLENVLRPWLAARLLARGGLLVHSAAVSGFLFAGVSGAGKSTIAKMGIDAGRPVSSDDLNAVRDGVIAPLPFTGDLKEDQLHDEPVPLRAVVALHKGDHEELQEMSVAESASLLVRCAPYVNRDPHVAADLLARAHELAQSAPRFRLTFRRGANVWPILFERTS
jgi:hypothetical protein